MTQYSISPVTLISKQLYLDTEAIVKEITFFYIPVGNKSRNIGNTYIC